MASGSLLEQLTGTGSSATLILGAGAIVVAVLTYIIASRFLFSSKSSKSTSSKQQQQQSTKSKDGSTKRQQQSNESAAGKKKNKNKKNTSAATPPSPVKATVSSASPSSQSEESEEEEETAPVAVPTKKATPAAKKPVANEEKPKANGAKATTKPAVNEPVAQTQNTDAKKKSAKPAAAAAAAPAPTTKAPSAAAGGKGATGTKKQSAAVEATANRSSAVEKETDIVVDYDDEGQWVTQGGKQVNNRNRNKGKSETTTATDNAQDVTGSPTSVAANRKSGAEKRSAAAPATSSANKTEVEGEPAVPVASVVAPTSAAPEPIEICQLLPSKENPYTASDDWWKQALNKPQSFSVDDIGEWPERDQDEQYVVNVKRIIPTRNVKTALTEKDVNVNPDVQDEINQQSNGNTQKRLDEPTNNVSQTKKKANNVRRVS